MPPSTARRSSGPPLWLVLGAPCVLLLAGVSQFVGECELQPSPAPGDYRSVAAPVTSQR
jgi:hypothetical protein